LAALQVGSVVVARGDLPLDPRHVSAISGRSAVLSLVAAHSAANAVKRREPRLAPDPQCLAAAVHRVSALWSAPRAGDVDDAEPAITERSDVFRRDGIALHHLALALAAWHISAVELLMLPARVIEMRTAPAPQQRRCSRYFRHRAGSTAPS